MLVFLNFDYFFLPTNVSNESLLNLQNSIVGFLDLVGSHELLYERLLSTEDGINELDVSRCNMLKVATTG